MWNCLLNPDNLVRDVVICAVPWTDTNMPMMAPAALKPTVERANLTCLAVDLNQEVFQYTQQHPQRELFADFFFNGKSHPSIEDDLNRMFSDIATGILSYQPKWVGLSLLSYACQHSAKWIAWFLKKHNPDIKIIFGGAGCLPTFTGPSLYVNQLTEFGLLDYHIRGDGEHSLYELLVGNKNYEGIGTETWKEMSNDDIRTLPFPDYDDYDLDIYGKRVTPILGSRGCVRQCTFCDYIANWKNFRWRTGQDIFNEMLHQNQKYGANYFKFQDALINGNQKEFKALVRLLADHNDTNPSNQFKWSSFFIFRDITPNCEQDWDDMYRSGADVLMVGIENLNERIRYAMGKKFSNASIDFHLEQALKYNITCVLGQIVGYIDETEQDIDYIKQWLTTHTQFKDIILLQWGGTLGIFPNTYLMENKEFMGIKLVGPTPQHWISNKTTSTASDRVRWVKELVQLSKDLGYRVAENLDNHYILETLSNESN
jgi:hypothetical protein